MLTHNFSAYEPELESASRDFGTLPMDHLNTLSGNT